MAEVARLTTVLEVRDEVTAGLQRLERQLKDVQGSLETTARHTDSFGGSLKRVAETAAGFGVFTLAQNAIGGLKDMLGDAVKSAFDFNATIASQTTAFTSLLG